MKSRIAQNPFLFFLIILFLFFLYNPKSRAFSKMNVESNKALDYPELTLFADKLNYIFENGRDGYTCFKISPSEMVAERVNGNTK